MDGEPPGIPHESELKAEPVTIKGIVNATVETFLSTTKTEQGNYFMPEDALNHSYQALFSKDPGLTPYQVFLQLAPETTLSPDNVFTRTKDPLYENKRNWLELVDRFAEAESDDQNRIITKINKDILMGELAMPDNFSSPEVLDTFTIELHRRMEEQEVLNDKK